MDPTGSNVVRLTYDSAQDAQPAWSPDGTKIAFVSDRDGNADIYVMNADGSGPVNITKHAGADYAPAWSPDGTKIAFQSDRETDFAVWVMNADGSNPIRLTDPSTPAGAPSWSPDGTRIAYEQGGELSAAIELRRDEPLRHSCLSFRMRKSELALDRHHLRRAAIADDGDGDHRAGISRKPCPGIC